MRLWDAQTGEIIKTLPTSNISTNNVSFSPDEDKVIIQYTDGIPTYYRYELIDLETDELLADILIEPIGDRLSSLDGVAISYDNQYFLSETGELYNLETGSLLNNLPMNLIPGVEGYSKYQFSPDGKYIALLPTNIFSFSNETNFNVRIYSTESGEEVFRLNTSQYPVFAPDGLHLYTYGRGEPLKYWSLEPAQTQVKHWKLYN